MIFGFKNSAITKYQYDSQRRPIRYHNTRYSSQKSSLNPKKHQTD
ncbi:hypothetical protein C943_04375 [Mariniradius saccharolyticus AK6]|uniref:Uncharacterized protein n=1 Tax=Mariniradius saccharolyticus AK6 TaxID=1239962 RepID=M7XYD5_9BACT|nr:hypothetical protein C943_04375 [Mariniradius saccharolyticus AK6]